MGQRLDWPLFRSVGYEETRKSEESNKELNQRIQKRPAASTMVTSCAPASHGHIGHRKTFRPVAFMAPPPYRRPADDETAEPLERISKTFVTEGIVRRFLINASFGIAFMIAGCSGDAVGPTDVGSPSLDRTTVGCEFAIRFWANRLGHQADLIAQLEEQGSARPDDPGIRAAIEIAETRLAEMKIQAGDEINDACA